MARSVCFVYLVLVGAATVARTGVSEQIGLVGEVAQRDTDRPVYEVNFPRLDEHVATGAEHAETKPGVTAMRMVTARGQAMRCLLPAPPTPTTSHAPTPPENQFDDIDGLFRNYKDKCFLKYEGWWTYEFCFGKHVVQKHIIPKDRDPNHDEVEDVFVLGLMDRDLDLARRKNASEVSTKDAAFTQLFLNGTLCDTNNQPRRVLIKYMCKDEAVQVSDVKKSKSVAILKTVREVESCVYEAEFMNDAICRHPSYLEKMARFARPIYCSMEENEGPFEGLRSKTYKKASLSL